MADGWSLTAYTALFAALDMTTPGATIPASEPRTRARALLLLAVFTLALHLPFMLKPVQDDEGMYLDMAREVMKHPLTPLSFDYAFQGTVYNAEGHPHPPLNAGLLALLLWVRGGFSVAFFHAAYLVFPLLAAWAAYRLGERFTARPLWAALLFSAAPVVQVSFNTLGISEAPLLAFLPLGAVFFFDRRFIPAAVCLSLAGFSALQGLVIAPILLLDYAARRERPPRGAWLAAATPFVLLAGWQLFQYAVTGRLPLALLFGHATGSTYGRPALKLASALALVQHLGLMVVLVPLAGFSRRVLAVALGAGVAVALLFSAYPWWERALLVVFVAAGVQALWWIARSRRDQPFLAAWCLAFFAFALAAFFAGAAR